MTMPGPLTTQTQALPQSNLLVSTGSGFYSLMFLMCHFRADCSSPLRLICCESHHVGSTALWGVIRSGERRHRAALPFPCENRTQPSRYKLCCICSWASQPLDQWFSTSLMLGPFNIAPHVVVSPNHKVISLLLITGILPRLSIIMEISVFPLVLGDPSEKVTKGL